MDKKTIDEFVDSWKKGSLCLHMSDTLPGLSFDPLNPESVKKLISFKRRSEQKKCISLVSSLEQALTYWDKLSPRMEKFLAAYWPNSLSVVYKASVSAPRSLVSSDGFIALRYPKWSNLPHLAWMQQVVENCGSVFPSSSVNISGQKAAGSWQEAVELTKGENSLYIPKSYVSPRCPEEQSPSTILKFASDDEFIVLREGALLSEMLNDKNIIAKGEKYFLSL